MISREAALEQIERLRGTPLQRVRTVHRVPESFAYITRSEAAKIFCVSPDALYCIKGIGDVIERRSRSLNGSRAQGVGFLYSRADCEYLMKVKRETGIPLRQALRVVKAIKDGRIACQAHEARLL